MPLHLHPWQWALGALAGWLIGLSKTGVPGIGILVVPLLAAAFGGRPSVGIMLPMLIFGDCFAVYWYRRHADWSKLVGLLPWVVVGIGVGALALWGAGEVKSSRDIMSVLIGVVVLTMLGLHLLQKRLGDKLAPTSPIGIASTGMAAGFATTVSNAAGSIMTVYLLAHKLDKNKFMGTIALYFFIINLSKLPVYFALTAINPAKPVITSDSLLFVLLMSPVMLLGVLLGKRALPRFSQRSFDSTMLVLSAISALYLIVAHVVR